MYGTTVFKPWFPPSPLTSPHYRWGYTNRPDQVQRHLWRDEEVPQSHLVGEPWRVHNPLSRQQRRTNHPPRGGEGRALLPGPGPGRHQALNSQTPQAEPGAAPWTLTMSRRPTNREYIWGRPGRWLLALPVQHAPQDIPMCPASGVLSMSTTRSQSGRVHQPQAQTPKTVSRGGNLQEDPSEGDQREASERLEVVACPLRSKPRWTPCSSRGGLNNRPPPWVTQGRPGCMMPGSTHSARSPRASTWWRRRGPELPHCH